MKNKKLAIIVPYRDRQSHLEVFVPYMQEYLKDYDYKIFVIEQNDNKPFNRGKLLNVGARIAIKEGFDYFALHDVDMLPLKGVDYSYSETPIHLVSKINKDIPFMDYFGGVTLFNVHDYKLVNGYSNEYWGWGFEDDDLLWRCSQKGIPLDKKVIGKKEVKKIYGLYFNGKDSYIKIPKKDLFDFKKDISILVSFKPDDIISNPTKEYDEYTIFSIPGYDTNISYNSFRRYKCDIWDEQHNAVSINSEILTNHFTQICLVWDAENYILSFYKDGELIDEKELYTEILDYSEQEFFYLGVGSNDREFNNNYF